MRRGSTAASAEIAAPPANIYAILADYHNGHPHILPKPYFGEFTVEQGGIGAGTIIRFHMRVLGQDRVYRQQITEPDPGRVLVETDLDTGSVTTFTVIPVNDGQRTHVQISTEWSVRPGITGWIERVITARLLRSIYTKDLRQLAAYVATHSRAAHSGRPA